MLATKVSVVFSGPLGHSSYCYVWVLRSAIIIIYVVYNVFPLKEFESEPESTSVGESVGTCML